MSDSGWALLADIGGTNVRFALLAPGANTPASERTLQCSAFAGLVDAARHYLSLEDNPSVSAAAFAVAAPITSDHIALTNNAWSFSTYAVRDALGIEYLDIVNDFTALALSVPQLTPGELFQVGGGTPAAGGVIGVLGAGTGLGVSGLLHHHGQWLPISGEGGHVAFSPSNAREDELLRLLRKRFGDHVSAERLLSGSGLQNIYSALAERDGVPVRHLAPEELTRLAVTSEDALATETLEVFFGVFGTLAGNLALTLGARGGCYVGGGIIPALVDNFAASVFRSRFESQGRFTSYVAAIPVFVIMARNPALRGLVRLLRQSGRWGSS